MFFLKNKKEVFAWSLKHKCVLKSACSGSCGITELLKSFGKLLLLLLGEAIFPLDTWPSEVPFCIFFRVFLEGESFLGIFVFDCILILAERLDYFQLLARFIGVVLLLSTGDFFVGK